MTYIGVVVVVVVAGFNQSSPVHPLSESRGGNLSVTYIGVVVVVAARLYLSFLI